MISFRPITSRLYSRVFHTSVASCAERTLNLSHASRCSVELPITLPDESERIRAHHRYSVPAVNLERLTMRVVEQGPTRIHLLRNVLIGDGCLMSRTFFERMGRNERRFLLHGSPEHKSEATLCSTYFTEKYFGHWLKEGLGAEQLAIDLGIEPLALDRPAWLHEESYRSLVSIPARATRIARCDRVWVIEDPRYNAHFAHRYNRIRNRLREAVHAPVDPTARVFLSRGKLGKGRALANEDEVRNALSARGFMILDPESTGAAEVARSLAGAKLVVAPEGSAMSHATIALSPGAGLLGIIGAQHFNMMYKGACDALNLRFGFTIADATDDDRFSQPIDRLLRTIDLMESVAAANR